MKLRNIWSDGAVIQQNRKIRIEGEGIPYLPVSIELQQSSNQKAVRKKNGLCQKDGSFVIELPPMSASFKIFTLLVTQEKQTITVNNIVIGEVWLVSGQSNMALPVVNSLDKPLLFKKIKQQEIRFIHSQGFIEKEAGNTKRSIIPLKDIDYPGWRTIQDSNAVMQFSSMALAFGLTLYEALKIPIGLLNVAVGGTSIEAWMSHEQIKSDSLIIRHLKKTGRFVDEVEYNQRGAANYNQMGGLFNDKIAPLTSINIRGTIWLQGESSAGDEKEAGFYRKALSGMIKNWNIQFRNRKQPFLIGHISSQNYQISRYGVSYLNEAIDDVTRILGDFATQIPTYDNPLDWIIPNDLQSHPIHPGIKFPIGERFAFAALSKYYGQPGNFRVSNYEKVERGKDKISITFSNTGSGLKTKQNQAIRGFTIAGADGIHYDAQAKISGNNDAVIVFHEFVQNPQEVTYAFFDMNTHANLLNGENIPVVPFRTKRDNQQYSIPALWASCDLKEAWVNSFEWTLGGAEYKPLWSTGVISGTKHCKLAFDTGIKKQGDSSLKITYQPTFDTGCFVGVSPMINLTGYENQMRKFDFMTVDLFNPDEQEKVLVGVLVKTNNAKIYLLPIIDGEDTKVNVSIPPRSGFVRYKISLKTFYGCYLLRETKIPGDMSDVCEMQFTFRDEYKISPQRTIYLDDIKFGRN